MGFAEDDAVHVYVNLVFRRSSVTRINIRKKNLRNFRRNFAGALTSGASSLPSQILTALMKQCFSVIHFMRSQNMSL